MIKDISLNYTDMMKAIADVGGLFYQYRPCRRDVATMYDIENIKHGVVYAQTPLNMNDPFDSMIGYSSDKMYENCITMLVESLNIEDKNIEMIVIQLLKYKVIGKMAEFMQMLNDLRSYLFLKKKSMHKSNIQNVIFIQQYSNLLYKKCPASIKHIIPKEMFSIFLHIVSQMEKIDITEKNVFDMLDLNKLIEELYDKVAEIKDSIYVPYLRNLLEQLTVSCFSVSGWDNQLMWAHYANSYGGICIEYDFNQITKAIGFIYPVNYTKERPTLELKDFGIEGFDNGAEISIKKCKPNMESIFTYLLSKNECWQYEQEWRIINIGEANTPLFIDLPFIKSITIGMNIDSMCKYFLWDVCKEKGIECYEVETNTENFQLTRRKLCDGDFEYNTDKEVQYITLLLNHILDVSNNLNVLGENIDTEVKNMDFSNVNPVLSYAFDIIADSYFLKLSLKRIYENESGEMIILQEIISNIAVVNGFISGIRNMLISIQESISELTISGIMGTENYSEMQRRLSDALELVEKFESIKLDLSCIGEETNIMKD